MSAPSTDGTHREENPMTNEATGALAVCPVCRDVPAQQDLDEPCGRCSRQLIALDLGRPGVLYTRTTVYRAPPGVEVPFCLAYGDFDPDLRLLAHLPVDSELRPGDPVAMVRDADNIFRFVEVEGASSR
jgi:uncharacterized OB-fold protein